MRKSRRVSILGLVDKGLRLFLCLFVLLTIFVSILGLVDKGLRLQWAESFQSPFRVVSILGLVDKGLRQNWHKR